MSKNFLVQLFALKYFTVSDLNREASDCVLLCIMSDIMTTKELDKDFCFQNILMDV